MCYYQEYIQDLSKTVLWRDRMFSVKERTYEEDGENVRKLWFFE